MILGILGGMGPLATCDLFQKIIELTDVSKDKEHLHIIIDNNTQIPDRTEYILGFGEDPSTEMIKSIIKLKDMGVDYIAIPCNTAHYFYDNIVKYTNIKIIHMIEETAIFIHNANTKNKDYLLLATEGTYKSEVYKKVFKKFDLNILEPNKEDKKIIMDWICKIKASKFEISRKEYDSIIKKYVENKKTNIILGCTELPILAKRIGLSEEEYIDPTLILAKSCVEFAKRGKNQFKKNSL